MHSYLKRYSCFFRSFLLLSLLPGLALADWLYEPSRKTISDGNWSLNVSKAPGGGLAVTGGGAVTSGETLDLASPVVDAEGKAYPVVSISGFQGRGDLRELFLPDTLETIEANAFSGCKALTKVEPFLPASIRMIAPQAFLNCENLSGDLVCGSERLSQIGATAFYGTAIRSVDLPHVDVLEKEAFQDCSSLKEVKLPEAVSLGSWAFKNCLAMTNATFSSSLKRIELQAFYNCPRLATISPFLPDSVTFLGNNAFWGTPALQTHLTLRGVTEIQNGAFAGSGVLSADLASVEIIGNDAFSGAASLREVTFSSSLHTIRDRAFLNCKKLKTVTPFLPDSVTSIGAEAFNYCEAIESPLYLENPAMTTFHWKSFRHIPGLVEVHFCQSSIDFSDANSLFYNSGAPARYYFPRLAPQKKMSSEVFAYTGGKRSVLYGSLRLDPEGWTAFASPLNDADRAAPDYPGEKTFGVSIDPVFGVRHWLVDYTSPLEAPDSLEIAIEPAGLPVLVTPAIGVTDGLAQGDSVACSAPAEGLMENVHYRCAGYVLEELEGGVAVSSTTNLGVTACSYTHGDRSARLIWLYEADGFPLSAVPVEDGAGTIAVSPPPNLGGGWYANGTMVTVTALPADGRHFSWWFGDIEDKNRGKDSVTMVMDRSRSIQAAFHRGWLYDRAAGTMTDGNWILSVTRDADDALSIIGPVDFKTPSTLDFRTPVTDGEGTVYPIVSVGGFRNLVGLKMVFLPDTLVSIAPSAFQICQALTTVVPFLPASVTSVGELAFDGCTMVEGPLYLTNPAMTSFNHRSFRHTAKLDEVHFSPSAADFSKADSLFYGGKAPARYYFPKLAPTLPIFNETFSYAGYKRSILFGSLRLDRKGWNALATDLTEADRAAPDYPGDKAFGVYVDPWSKTRHWLVDWESPLESVRLLEIATSPAGLPVGCLPEIGSKTTLGQGDQVACSAPAAFVHQGLHYELTGYALQEFKDGLWCDPVTNLGVRSTVYEQGEWTSRIIWLYRIDGYHLDCALLGGREGKVTISPQPDLSEGCYATGTRVSVAAVPAEGDYFTWWLGDIDESERLSQSAEVTMDRPRVLRAACQPGWLYDPADGTMTDGDWVLRVSGQANGDLAVTAVISAVDGAILNLRTPVADGDGNRYSIRSVAGFGNRKTLRSVLLPDTLLSLKGWAFSDCTALASVAPFLPASLTNLEDRVFNNCTSLSGKLSIRTPGLLATGALSFYATAVESVDLPHVERLGDDCFGDCVSLREVRMASLVSVGARAFRGCEALERVEPFLSDTVTTIGVAAFEHCGKLKGRLACRHPDCKSISAWAFNDTAVEAVDLPHVESLGGCAFRDCRSLETVSFPKLVTLSNEAFLDCVSLRQVSPLLPATVTAVGHHAFANCGDLAGDLVGENPALKEIGATAFYGTKLIHVDLPYVETLGLEAFQECHSLADAKIPRIVTLDKWAFKNCRSMTWIEISDGLATARTQAFCGCSKLERIDPWSFRSLTELGESVFQGCASLHEPLSFESEAVKRLPRNVFASCNRLGTVRLPHVEELGEGAFIQCVGLTNLVFSSALTNIGVGAIQACRGLEELSLPPGLTTIGERAFAQCSSLVRITPFLPDSVSSIGSMAFDECKKLEGPLFVQGEGMTHFSQRSFRWNYALQEVHFSPKAVDFSEAPALFFDMGTPARYYFPKAAPKMPIRDEVFTYRGVTRSTIYGSLRLDPKGWAAVATELTPEDLAAADYPGPKTFGVYVDPLSKTRHWLVDWRSPLECRATILLLR